MKEEVAAKRLNIFVTRELDNTTLHWPPYVARCLELVFLAGMIWWLLELTFIRSFSPYLYFARFLDKIGSLIFNNRASFLELDKTETYMIYLISNDLLK